MDLVIDIGNSLHKIGLYSEEGELELFLQYDYLRKEDLEVLLSIYPVRHSILSSVGKEDTGLKDLLESKTIFTHFSHESLLPVEIRYKNPQSLGLDRIANAVAAHMEYADENILSIQAGTCLVYDFTDRNGIYHGGAISPGLNMRFKALNYFTEKLPLYSKKEIDFLTGTSTQQSIESGVINGVINEINGFMAQYEARYPGIKILLSGGDSAYLQKSIKNAIFVGSKFILNGLHKILKLNVENL